MACRLFNRHTHPLYIDLRGGETLPLAPGETSRALLEELLYDNQHLPQWEAAGWIVRLPARFAETQPQAAAPAEEAQPEEGEPEEEDEEETEAGTGDDPDAASPRRRRRRTRR